MLFAYLGIKTNGENNTVSATWIYWSIAIIFYTVILGLRENVGIDYKGGLNVFADLLDLNSYSFAEIDIIYLIFIPIVKNFHYNFFIAFLAFLPIYFTFQCFKNKTQFLLWFLFFYFTCLTFFTTLNIMRQYAAWFVIFYAINKFLEKDYKRFILYYILAFLLHRSVLLFLPFIFLCRYDFTKWRWLFVSLLIISYRWGEIIFFSSFDSLIQNLSIDLYMGTYDGYINQYDYWIDRTLEANAEAKAQGLGIYGLLILVVDCIAIFFSKKLKEEYKEYNFLLFYNFFIIGAVFMNIFGYHETLKRAVVYFVLYRNLIYAIMFYYIFTKMRNRYLALKAIFIVIMFMLILFFYSNIHRKIMEIAPYHFISL
jgi:hypothetical protein